MSGQCQCQGTQIQCGGQIGCADLASDPQSCDSAPGTTYCGPDDGCVDLETDKDNCGQCGNNCDGGQTCVQGDCKGG